MNNIYICIYTFIISAANARQRTVTYTRLHDNLWSLTNSMQSLSLSRARLYGLPQRRVLNSRSRKSMCGKLTSRPRQTPQLGDHIITTVPIPSMSGSVLIYARTQQPRVCTQQENPQHITTKNKNNSSTYCLLYSSGVSIF